MSKRGSATTRTAPMGPPGDPQDTPPHNLAVERDVLGACLQFDVIGDVGEQVVPRDFYHEAHRGIFTALLELYEDGEPIDTTTVAEKLKQMGDLEQVGGIVYLMGLATNVATGVNAGRHARILKDCSLKRQAMDLGRKLASQAADPTQDIGTVLAEADETLLRLAMGRAREGGFRPICDIYEDLLAEIDENKRRGTDLAGLNTGFPSMNDATGGFEPGDLWIIAARPSEGKTALLMQLGRFLASLNKVPGAVFELEMSSRQLATRQASEYTSTNSMRLKTGRLSNAEWTRFSGSLSHLTSLPLYVDDTSGLSILEARARARRLQKQHGLGFVLVDYLQLMSASDCQTREQEVSKVARGLKGMAKELAVPVIAAAQLNRGPEYRSDRRPMMADLRESGAIEQAADGVMFIYPLAKGKKAAEGEDLKGKVEIIVAKQRNGRTGPFPLTWVEEFTSFRDPQWARVEEDPGDLCRWYWLK